MPTRESTTSPDHIPGPTRTAAATAEPWRPAARLGVTRCRDTRGWRAMAREHKIILSEDEMPTRWYNVVHDLPSAPPPPLHPGTLQPVGPEDLAPLFPMALIEQEVT